VDLVQLNGRVDAYPEVVEAQANDLNCILLSERVVNEEELVQQTKDEEGEVCWN
jgi:hypothetical protein